MEVLSAVASVGTFLVILVTAVAAFIQLRHMRSGNQIAALTECREIIESREFFTARRFVQDDLPILLQDPAIVPRLERRVLDDQLQPINFIGNFFENLGAFVRFGIIDRAIVLDMWCLVVLAAWRALLPVTQIRRKFFKTRAFLENFEYLAVLCDDYIARHPDGTYPSGMRRMPDS